MPPPDPPATGLPADALEAALARFFDASVPLGRGDRLVVAFSGGPDSTALLLGASRLARRRHFEVLAAHLDHGLDSDSPRRAAAAGALASRLGVRFVAERRRPPAAPRHGVEDWARRARYDFLERCRAAHRGRYVATAHQRDDQIETVLLRLLLGSGLEGLGGIEPHRGTVVRPLLTLGRGDLEAALAGTGLVPVADPTNEDPARPRNRVRRRLVPRLLARHPELGERLVRVAALTRRLSRRLEEDLTRRLAVTATPGAGSVDVAAFTALATSLRPFGLGLLHRAVGLGYPAGAHARRELDRQLDRWLASGAGRVGCDCGHGWRWERRGARLRLGRSVTPTPPFAYTLDVPGDVVIPELGLCVSISRQPVAAWMFEGHPRRAALELPGEALGPLTVRNRRPGDRIRPLGCGYSRRLKEVLIDRGIPRQQRDRLPLLCLDDRVAWVPGLTIDEAFRVTDRSHAWIVSLEPA